MAKASSFHDLTVWREAMALVEDVQRALHYHLAVALGSQGEVEVQLEIGRRLGL